jgi:hypothetical protein
MSMTIDYVVDVERSTVELAVDSVGPTTIWRTSPSGTSVAVRGAYLADGGDDGRLTIYDYEIPIGVPVTYRAVYGDPTTGPDQGDAIGPDTPEILIETTDSWLVDLWDASNSLKPWVEDMTRTDYDIEADAQYPLMRRTPIVAGNVRRAAAGTLRILTETDADAASLRRLVANGVPILFQAPMQYGVGNLYMTIGRVAEERVTSRGAEPIRRFSLDYLEVERPRPEWVVSLDQMTNINFADALLIYGWFGNIDQRCQDFEALRTTKKGAIGGGDGDDQTVTAPIRHPDLTWRGE